MNDSITTAIISLLKQEMFYGEIISQMRRCINHNIPVAGVCIKNQIELHINPKGFDDLSPKERVSVLRHECEHILRDHILRFKEIYPEVFEKNKEIADTVINNMKFKAMNISADCAINGNMANLPEWGVFPKTFNLPEGNTMEWYLENLKDNEKMKDLMEFDDHSLWKESDEQSKEVLREKIRQVINKAANKARVAGKMSSYNELLVSELNKNQVNWKQQLRRFIARSSKFHLEESRKRRNKRYGITVPGAIKIEDLHIGVAIDTSGSVSDQALKQFMSEIANIAKYAKVTVVEADSEIKNAYEFKPKKEYSLSGRGGTAYQPAFDYFNNQKDIDGVIYFGDMDSSDTPKKPKYPVLWSIIGHQEPPASFGYKIRIQE